MAGLGYFIRRRREECSIVKVLPNGGAEILERGLTLVEAETLYFVCIGEPVHEPSAVDIVADDVGRDAGGLGSSHSSSETLSPALLMPGGFFLRPPTDGARRGNCDKIADRILIK
jgi:hypothetical protein